MFSKTKLYIVDIEESTIHRLTELFFNNPDLGISVIGSSHTHSSTLEDIGKAREANVFLISVSLPDSRGTELLSHLSKANPNAKFILTLDANTRNLSEDCFEKGAHVVLQKPFKAKELVDNIQKLTNDVNESPEKNNPFSEPFQPRPEQQSPQFTPPPVSDSKHDYFKEPSPENPYPFTVSQEKTDYGFQSVDRPLFDMREQSHSPSSPFDFGSVSFDGEKPAYVVTIASTSSTGKSSVLSQVAASIAMQSAYKPRICILDFNLLFPSVKINFLDEEMSVKPKKNIYDLCLDLNHLSKELIMEASYVHKPTGITIINTPKDIIRDFNSVNAHSIERIVSVLKEHFDLILIDTSSNIREDASSFPLTISDKVFVIVEPDLSSLLHTRKLVTMLKHYETKMTEKITSKLNLVLNKQHPKKDVTVETVKKSIFGYDVRVSIPEDHLMTKYCNNGQFLYNSTTSLAKPINELARLVYPFDKELSYSDTNGSKEEKKQSNFLNSFLGRKK